MKQFYQIHELAKLFDLCPDTLRYYEEKGLLHPVRGENRYRMYGIQDVCTLNIIRALRELKIPTRAIRTYLERRSVGETLSLLDREEALLRRRMAELEAALEEARARRARLEQYRAAEDGRVFFRREAERPYVFLEEDIILEKEIDFLLKKLEHRHQDYLKIIGSQCMGAAVDEEWLSRGVYNHFSRVFFLTEPGLPHDDALPAGSTPASITVGPMTAWRSTAASCWRGSRRRPPPGGAAPGAVPGGRPRPTGRRSTSPSCKCG
ncbi:MAG: MerR family transcriptional regulator [Flavonifractor plautii]